jgi:hypothetical protein
VTANAWLTIVAVAAMVMVVAVVLGVVRQTPGASGSKCGAGESDRLPPAHQDQHENDDRHDHPKLPISH